MKRGTMTKEEIREVMKVLNLTVTELAYHCGVSYHTINSYLNGGQVINMLVEEHIKNMVKDLTEHTKDIDKAPVK